MLEKTICAVVLREDIDKKEDILAYISTTPQIAIAWLQREGLDYETIPYHFSLNQLKVDYEGKDIVLPGETQFMVKPKVEVIETYPFVRPFEEGSIEEVYTVSLRSEDLFETPESLKEALFVSHSNKDGYEAEYIIHVASSQELAEKWLLKHAKDYHLDQSYFFSISGENLDYIGFYPEGKYIASDFFGLYNKDGSLDLDYHSEENE